MRGLTFAVSSMASAGTALEQTHRFILDDICEAGVCTERNLLVG